MKVDNKLVMKLQTWAQEITYTFTVQLVVKFCYQDL